MKIAILANPAARGKRLSFIESFRMRCRELGHDVTLELTRGPGDGVRLARELAAKADVLGIIGGDGTVHEAINGLMPEPIPVVIVPAGSGNDFASLVACPATPDEFIELAKAGTGARIDVLSIGDRFCINSAGLGFEGIVNKYSHDIKVLGGSFLYMAAVLRALTSLVCPHFHIETSDGQRVEGEKLLVSIGNGNRSGGAFYMVPDAYPDDGLIDVCCVDRLSRGRLVRLLPKTFKGSHTGLDEVQMLRAERMTIRTRGVFPIHVDGELVEEPPEELEFRVYPRILPVLCKPSADNRLNYPLEKVL
jgi:diacylglycerol kinase (ATP)